MSLWMILRIGRADWGYPGDNCAGPCDWTRERSQPRERPIRLSTRAVHGRAALTRSNITVPRVHRTYYDY